MSSDFIERDVRPGVGAQNMSMRCIKHNGMHARREAAVRTEQLLADTVLCAGRRGGKQLQLLQVRPGHNSHDEQDDG